MWKRLILTLQILTSLPKFVKNTNWALVRVLQSVNEGKNKVRQSDLKGFTRQL